MKILCFIFFSSALMAQNIETISFEEVIQKAVERNTKVSGEQARLGALKGMNLPKHLTLLPSINIEAAHTVTDVGPSTQTTQSVSAVARMNIFKFGADGATMRQANASEEAQEYNIADTVLRAENEIVRILTAVIGAEKRVAILRELVEIRSQAKQIAKERYGKGLLSQQESAMIDVDHDNSLAELRDAESELVSAKAKLFASAGPYSTKAEWPWLKSFERSDLIKASLESLKNRPDWKSADAAVKAAEASASASFGQMLPSLDLVASYGHMNNLTLSSKGNEWTGSITLTVPLFDKLSNYGLYRSAVWSKAQSEYEREQVIRDARSSWETAKGAFAIALETAKNREKTLATTERIYQDDLSRFKRGAISVNDVNISLGRVLNSKTLAIQGWASAHEQFTDLCHSLGRRILDCVSEK